MSRVADTMAADFFDGEVWRPVLGHEEFGFEHAYEVSDSGGVRRVLAVARTCARVGYNMKQRMDQYGYLVVALRHKRRTRNCRVHLTDADMRHIRLLLSDGTITQAKIARHYGVSGVSISAIASGRTWRLVV